MISHGGSEIMTLQSTSGALSSHPSARPVSPGSLKSQPGSPVITDPILRSRPVSPELLKKHDFYLANTHNIVEKTQLTYPCRDKSDGVLNFSKWSYFKDAPPKKITNMASSHLWNKEFLDKINNRVARNKAAIPKKSLAPIRTTKAERMRKQYQKMSSAPMEELSDVSAMGGSLHSYVFSDHSETASTKSTSKYK
jgi:hypothetical protein